MKNLFIFTASGSKPKKHIEITVENPYRKEPFEQHIIDQELINNIQSEGDCYCWGNTSSGWTHGRWIDLKVGDYYHKSRM